MCNATTTREHTVRSLSTEVTPSQLSGVLLFRAFRAAAVLGLVASVVHAQALPQPTRLAEASRIDGEANLFERIGWTTLLPDGRIAVALVPERQVHLFDAGGRRVGVIGREGSGPGELRSVGQYGWLGDSLWISDPSLRRITLFGTSTFQRMRELRWPTTLVIPATSQSGERSGGIITIPMLANGAEVMAIAAGYQGSRSAAGQSDAPRPAVLRVRLDDGRGQLVGRIPGALCWGSPTFANATPLCPVYRVAFSPSGDRFGIAGPAPEWPGTPQITVVVLRATGDTAFSVALPAPAIRVPERVRDSITANPLPRGLAGRRPEPSRYYPPIRGIIMGRDGTSWVEVASVGPERRWVVLNERGEVKGVVSVSSQVTLKEVGRDYALGIERDQDGVQSVVRFRHSLSVPSR
jgi:hypothetical protein